MADFFCMHIQKDVLQVVGMDFRHKVWVILDEVDQIIRDFAIIFKGDKNIYITLFPILG
jgi:hypothetical protein